MLPKTEKATGNNENKSNEKYSGGKEVSSEENSGSEVGYQKNAWKEGC